MPELAPEPEGLVAPLGLVVLPEAPEPVVAPPEPVVLLPEPVVLPELGVPESPFAASRMQRSFSSPVIAAHRSVPVAEALPVTPVLPEALLPLEESVLVLEPAPAEPETLVLGVSLLLVLAPAPAEAPFGSPPLALGLVLAPAPAEPLVEVDGVVVALVLPLAPVLPLALVLPLAEPSSRRQRSFAAPVMLSQSFAMPVAALEALPPVCAPVLLLLPDCAKDAPDNARSAAAVELTITFSIICVLLWGQLKLQRR